MDYRPLGATGVEISRVILGCGNFGGIGSAPELFGQGESDEAAAAIMDAAWTAGITTFDTADAYGGGRSERAIGCWLARQDEDVQKRIVICSKVFNPMGVGEDSGLSRRRILRQLPSSLERLGVERLDLYLTHEPDPAAPLEETLGALEELRRDGFVRAVGVSNVDAGQLREALELGARDGLARPGCVQNSFSLLDRADEADVLPLCRREELGYTPFSPLAGGWLTGKYRQGQPPPPGSRMTMRPEPYAPFQTRRTFEALDVLRTLAGERSVEMAAIALAWLLRRPGVTGVVGPRRAEHLRPALEALELTLEDEEEQRLSEVFAR